MSKKSSNHVLRIEALAMLREAWKLERKTEQIAVNSAAINRVVATYVSSKMTLPVFRGSLADGIAVRYDSFQNGIPNVADWKRGIDYVMANTGDDFPDEFDTVIKVEELDFDDERNVTSIHTDISVTKGQLTRIRGSIVNEGELLVQKGTTLRPYHLSVLGTGGIEMVEVYQRPTVAFIPTGDELIPVGQEPKRGQNIEANSLMIEAYLEEWGVEPIIYPIIPDSITELESVLDHAIEKADIVLIGGGTSKGSVDYTAKVLKNKSSFMQHGVRSMPGYPVGLALIKGTPVINLPGPNVGSFCAMDWAVRALVYDFDGRSLPKRERVKAKLLKGFKKPDTHEMYVRVQLTGSKSDYSALPLNWKVRFAESNYLLNGLFIAPTGQSKWEAGDEVEVELL